MAHRLAEQAPNLELLQETVVVGMGTDPEPDHGVPLEHAERGVALADPNGVDRLGPVDLLEAETGLP